MSGLHTLAFEVGTEEIPAFDLHQAMLQLEKIVPAALDEARIPHGAVRIHTTPRRLIALVSDLADATLALEETFRGPSARIAFDEKGAPTKAAAGFARGKKVAVEDLERREEGGVEYVYARRSVPARESAGLLPEVLLGVIEAIAWPKSCRWGTTGVYFSRPVRWLLALLDERVIPVSFAGLTAGRLTRGHRFLAPGPHEVPRAEDLLDVLAQAQVLASESAREAAIRSGVAEAERRLGAQARLPERTLLEVTNLCEQPTVLVGGFDEEFLQVPEEIIVDAMLMHQRYFPLYDEKGSLVNRFIVVSNGDPAHADAIVEGNERVVRARLSDAKFFYEEDLKQPLESYVDRLDEVVFQEALGTMKDKAERIGALAGRLAEDAGLGRADAADAVRAARLAKADLVTNAVVEFTSVQGVMGSYYAAACGEPAQVALAIAEHYRPRFSGDAAPTSAVGRIVAMADKLDTICGLFAVGQAPSGSSDPFALRRGAIGIVSMLEAGLPVSLAPAVEAALEGYARTGIAFDAAAASAAVIDFFVTRTKVMLRDSSCPPDAVEAVLAAGVVEPAQIIARARALEQARDEAPAVFEDLATAYARANNLRDADLGTEASEKLMSCRSERSLAAAIEASQAQVSAAMAADDFAGALGALAALRAPIDEFFSEVLIMDEDQKTRENHLRMLNRIVAVFSQVADFGALAKDAK